MPYIKQEQRQAFDPHLEMLAKEIAAQTASFDWPQFSGMLNYCITSLALRTIDRLRLPKNYALIALVSGVFANVQSEFYRRYASPYEDDKSYQNGDVF